MCNEIEFDYLSFELLISALAIRGRHSESRPQSKLVTLSFSFRMNLYGLVETVGLVFCAYVCLKILFWVVLRIRAYSPFSKPIDFQKLGSWSVITGGTDGIGAEYARQLAVLGQNIIIVGRNAEKLAKMKSEIQNRSTKSPREVILIQADLSKQVWLKLKPFHYLIIDQIQSNKNHNTVNC